VVNNHFVSKGADDPIFDRVQPPEAISETKRKIQARVVNEFVDSILALDLNANIIVAGDLNDFEFSSSLDLLKGGVLYNLVERLEPEKRYSYIFQGNSGAIDHILVSNNLFVNANPRSEIAHLNSEFTDQQRPTDHDPVISRFSLTEDFAWMLFYPAFIKKD
jgi:predicted extracellular nuclease